MINFPRVSIYWKCFYYFGFNIYRNRIFRKKSKKTFWLPRFSFCNESGLYVFEMLWLKYNFELLWTRASWNKGPGIANKTLRQLEDVRDSVIEQGFYTPSFEAKILLATELFWKDKVPYASLSFSEGSLYGYWKISYWGVDCEFFEDKIVLTADDLRLPLSIEKAITKTFYKEENIVEEVNSFLFSLKAK